MNVKRFSNKYIMRNIKKLVLLISVCIFSFLITACTTNPIQQNTNYPNNIKFVDKNKKIIFELDRKKYHICGNFSESRLFCIGIKTGINVDKAEEVYSNVLVNLYLLDNKGNLIKTYENAIIPAHDIEFLQDYIPGFENGMAKIYLVSNNDTNKLTGEDIISKNDINEIYINRQGKEIKKLIDLCNKTDDIKGKYNDNRKF